jgi:hypothetical protein
MSDDLPDDASEDRRAGDDRRDGDERRKFRDSDGRRDDAADARRRSDRGGRRRLWPFVFAALLIAGVVFYRSVAVAPLRAARGQAEIAQRIAAPILERTSLSLQALPGFSPPIAGDPALGPVISAADDSTLESLSARLELASSVAPREPAVFAVAAPIRFAAGDERGARRAWEELLSLGKKEDLDGARIGLASLNIRAALRSADEQDRHFALEVALHQLSFVPEGSPLWDYRLVEEVIARLILEDEAAVDAALVELSALSSPVADAALPLLRSIRSGEEQLSLTLDEARAHEEPDEG